MSYEISLEFTLKRKFYSVPAFWNYRSYCGDPIALRTDFRRQCYPFQTCASAPLNVTLRQHALVPQHSTSVMQLLWAMS